MQNLTALDRILAERTASAQSSDVGAEGSAAILMMKEAERLSNAWQEQAALDQWQRALEKVEAAFGPHHPLSAICITGIGTQQLKQGRFMDAERTFKDAAQRLEGRVAPLHPAIFANELQRARLMMQRDRRDAALAMYTRLLEDAQKAFGADSLEVAAVAHDMGRLHHLRQDWPAAKQAFNRAALIRETRLGSDAPMLAQTLS